MAAITTERELRLTGVPISDGVVLAKVHFVESVRNTATRYYRIGEGAVELEKERLRGALRTAVEQLDALIQEVTKRISSAQANIFVAQRMMVEDPVLMEEMFGVIEQKHMNAEAAVERSLDGYESVLAELDNEYLRERASDIGEIRRRLLFILHERGPGAGVQEDAPELEGFRIMVAEELTPSETVSLDSERTVGFITEKGGPASHSAILARALGIPAVSGIRSIRKVFGHGEEVLLNGTSGEIIRWPSQSTLRLYPTAQRPSARPFQSVDPVEGFRVMANMSLTNELDNVRNVQAEGVGLYRTEFECFAAGRLLNEQEQFERYSAVLQSLDGKPLYLRLLDFGADKPASFLDLPREENPCLGYRGARLLLGRPDLLITQARAIARASECGPVSVIYPMVVDVDQFTRMRALFQQHTRDLPQGNIHHGIMFEVPAACMDAESMLQVADFASIGSNDLIQYLFAVDRNNESVAADFGPDHPVFWSLIQHMASAAEKHGKPLSLCGEIGGQPQYIPRIIECGIRTVSVSSRLVSLARLAAKRYLRKIEPES